MPLVAHNPLPTFEHLRQDGQVVLSLESAQRQDIREQHIGLLNMMPDTALTVTERQFFRLIGESNAIVQFYIYPFTLAEIKRSKKTTDYIKTYYHSLADIQSKKLDALVITGANVVGNVLSNQVFWQPLIKIIDWADQNVTSTLCSCLATHAVMEFRYGQKRIAQEKKIWGIYPHTVVDPTHPLVVGINSRFDVPHSRWNAITKKQFNQASLHILAQCEQGVHLASSSDNRFVFLQGHQEYDTISLLKEYKRDLLLYAQGQLNHEPPFPDAYLKEREQAICEEYKDQLYTAVAKQHNLPPFPEAIIAPTLENTWRDSAKSVIGNWTGYIYQVNL